MDERLQRMARNVRAGEHKRHRQAVVPDVLAECERLHLDWTQRVARLTRRMCEAEIPVIAPDERIAFTRTVTTVPPIYSCDDWTYLTAGHTLHELGPISNICADWGMPLSQGLLSRRQVALATRARLADDVRAVIFLDAAIETIDALLALASRYATAARECGRDDIAEMLEWVPAHRPRTFREALQSLRLMHAVVWLSGHYHVGLGRFDQYMWPFLEADLAAGRETVGSAEDLVAELFIALNKDSDLYPGVQQGDNGQSLTVGGVTPDGSDGTNELTRIVLRAALATNLIDPKINLRISPETDLDLLSLATQLTRRGLGFPQYSNDAVVIPALVAHGYAEADARNYTVAACWEFIIPGKGMEIVNIGAVSFPAAVDAAIRETLPAGGTFNDLLVRTAAGIRAQLATIVGAYSELLLPPAPYYSVLMGDCLERGRDLSEGLTYNGFGVHGAASADAADALAAVKTLVFETGRVSGQELVAALDADYEGYEALRLVLANAAPRTGNGDAQADGLLTWLFDTFADACDAFPDNGRGGRIRPGTGSAMYYVWLARGHEKMREPVVGATANGRHKGSYFSANLSPAHNSRAKSPTSILRTFAGIDYERVYNGGPITLELSDAVFQGDDSTRKVAMLVSSFAQLGCQQLQVNTVSLEALRDARVHPEQHRNLVVRVWGWSAYFCDLDVEYQEHVIERQMHTVA